MAKKQTPDKITVFSNLKLTVFSDLKQGEMFIFKRKPQYLCMRVSNCPHHGDCYGRPRYVKLETAEVIGVIDTEVQVYRVKLFAVE